jgi:hypothetical protein
VPAVRPDDVVRALLAGLPDAAPTPLLTLRLAQGVLREDAVVPAEEAFTDG